MKKIVVGTPIDFKTMKLFHLYKMNKMSLRMTIIKYGFTLAMLGILIFFGIKTFTNWDPEAPGNTSNVILFAVCCVFLIFMVYRFFNFEKSIDMQLTRIFQTREVSTQIVELYEEKLLNTTTNEEFTDISFKFYDKKNPNNEKYSSAYIQEIHEVNEYYYLIISKQVQLIISKNEESFIEGDLSTLNSLIDTLALTKKYVKYFKKVNRIPITYVHTYVAPVVIESAQPIIVDDEKKAVEEDVNSDSCCNKGCCDKEKKDCSE